MASRSRDIAAPNDTLTTVRSNAVVVAEYQGITATVADAACAVEWRSSPVIDASAPADWSSIAARNSTSPAEWSSSIQAIAAVPAFWTAAIQGDTPAAIEAARTVATNATATIETGAGYAVSFTAPAAWQATTRLDIPLTLEFGVTLIARSVDAAIGVEFTQAILSDVPVQFEWGRTASGIQRLTKGAATSALWTAPISAPSSAPVSPTTKGASTVPPGGSKLL
jgi:hypothetical protein